MRVDESVWTVTGLPKESYMDMSSVLAVVDAVVDGTILLTFPNMLMFFHWAAVADMDMATYRTRLSQNSIHQSKL